MKLTPQRRAIAGSDMISSEVVEKLTGFTAHDVRFTSEYGV